MFARVQQAATLTVGFDSTLNAYKVLSVTARIIVSYRVNENAQIWTYRTRGKAEVGLKGMGTDPLLSGKDNTEQFI